MNRHVDPAALAGLGPGDLRVEVLSLADLCAREAAWERLVGEAAYPNPHFSPRVVRVHVENGVGPQEPRFVTAWRGDDLVALLPFLEGGACVGVLRAALAPFTSPYVTDVTPLVSRTLLRGGIRALAGGMSAAAGPRGIWRLPLLATGSEVGSALLAALGRHGWHHAAVTSFERPVLERRSSYDEFARGLRGRAKDLRRRRRRLAEQGEVEHQAHTSGPELAAAVEAFLALERAGWKGARGTALACRPATAAFARQLFAGGQDAVTARADVLALDGRAVAISLALVCGGTAFLLKTAYDESLRASAPGLLLEDDIVRAAHETGFADRLDSATAAESVLEGIYPDRETIGDVVIARDPRRLAALVRAERRRQEWTAQAKRLVRRLRAR